MDRLRALSKLGFNMKTGDFVIWKDRPQYGILTIVRTSHFFQKVFKCSGFGMPYDYHWLDACDLEPYQLKKGDSVYLHQKNGAYNGYKGAVLDNPTKDGFDVSDGKSVVSVMSGDVLKEIRRRNKLHGLITHKTFVFIK